MDLMDNIVADENAITSVCFLSDGELVKPYLLDDDIPASSDKTPLNPAEKELLEECIRTIDEGYMAFFEVGIRLFMIKAGKLYRETHSSFEAFCKEKWDFSRAHADRLIKASQVVKVLHTAPVGDVAIPTTESQARPLTSLTDDQVKRAGRLVKKAKGAVTAADFKDAAAQVAPVNKPKVNNASKAPMIIEKDVSDQLVEALDDAMKIARENKFPKQIIDGINAVMKLVKEEQNEIK